MRYAQGKTPLIVRMERFVDWYRFTNGRLPSYIPIHPKELNKLWDKASFSGIATVYDETYVMLPLGTRV